MIKNLPVHLGVLFLAFATMDIAAAKIRVACVGDSITFGSTIRDRNNNSYPAQLQGLLGDNYEVRNFGRGGATLLKQGNLPYWKTEQFKDATAFNPEIVVIKLGTNDSKPDNWKHADQFEADLVALIEHFEKLPATPRVHLGIPAPVFETRWGINEKTVAGEIAPIIRKVSEERSMGRINFATALEGNEAVFPDKIHPNAAGAKIMAKTVAFAIESEAKESAGTRPIFKSGNMVALVGDAFIEQEQYSAWVELLLTTSQPNLNLKFRNLGWSADTPAGVSRFGLSPLQAGRAPADEGWKQLQKQLDLVQPDVAILGYGMASSLESGVDGLDKFAADMHRLIGRIRQAGSGPETRIVVLGTIAHEDLGPELGDAASHNQVLAKYNARLQEIAGKEGAIFVPLYQTLSKQAGLTEDGIHLNEQGYQTVAKLIDGRLNGKSAADQDRRMKNPNAETLRRVILQKNQWWFHRTRPANMAYVFGFRKHEQGQNAVEIPRFDRLIAEDESDIASLRTLKSVRLQLKKPQVESKYAKFTKQPTPEFTVGKDLEVTLWAENPQLNKPIQMNFDPQGRLYVASSEAYPMIEVGQHAPDKILMLEDTNGDGKSDKSTVFADGLLIPTGVEPGDGGVYVAQSTDLLFLKDTDGDGKADVKRRVLSGFGTEDTHHNLHTLRWGPDGRLYMNQSIYTRTDAETPRGVMRLKAGGGFRYNTKTMRMEVFFRGLVNSWGHQFDEYGQSFLTDGAGFQGIAYTFPGASFRPTPGSRRDLNLISPGNYPKFASKEIVYGKSFPADWQGSIVTCDFRANRVTRFDLVEQGSGFVTEQKEDLLRTSASTFRPIDVKQGPDGALYIADWSNPIINHGEVDFRDARRDRWHGRIWRVSWKGAKPTERQNIARLRTTPLLDSLTSDDRFVRDQSRRVLIDRGVETAKVLKTWLPKQKDEAARLQALWLHQALNVPNTKLLTELLNAKEPKIRAAAVRVLSDWSDPQTDSKRPMQADRATGLYRNRVADSHPRVRLEAVRGVAKLGTAKAAEVALLVLNKDMDRFLDYALWLSMNELADPFMNALESGKWKPDTAAKSKQLEFALSAIEPARAANYIAKRLKSQPITKEGSGPWIELIGKAGGREELKNLYQQLGAGSLNDAATRRGLAALETALRLRKQRPSGSLAGIGKFLTSGDEGIRVAGIRLAGAWKQGGQIGVLAQTAKQMNTSAAVRGAAINALREIGGGGAASALTGLTATGTDLGVRRHAVLALAGLGVNQAAAPFYQILGESKSEQQALDLWRGILPQRNAGTVLAAKVPAAGVSQAVARAGMRAAREGGRDEKALVAALTPHSGLTIKPEELTPARVQELIAKAAKDGSPGRGENVYSRPELGCVLCHSIGGVGGKVGPDMTSLGASAPKDYIIESLFKPNAKIKEGYHSVVIETKSELEYSGIEVRDADGELTIRNAANQIVRIPKNSIISKRNGMSLMPSGLLETLSEQETIDLIMFLTKLGTPGTYDASQGGVGRVYEIFAGTHRIEQHGADKIVTGELTKGWKPLLSRVNGNVAGHTLKVLTQQSKNISLVHVYARTGFEVAKTGEVTFAVAGVSKPALWVDGKRIDGDTSFTTKVAAGKHTVLVRMDAKEMPKILRVLSKDVAFATE
ncbi:MAG: putative heme-binding domain-containing protein [Limisphaerales bacterium]|jgi:putative heme-binding domain-containing protein